MRSTSIQQKTAVAPVVEMRDRNNLPVAGATVTFTIGGNAASFASGVQTHHRGHQRGRSGGRGGHQPDR